MKTPVLIIGCGPIGITGALLLARFGIKSVLIEQRGELNTHPRSRFVDTNTMEMMREFGVEQEIEDTGLGPDWTRVNRWSESLCHGEIAVIPAPTFHTVPNDTSPCKPVMTCQDYVENVLIGLVRKNELIDLRFNTEAIELTQDSDGIRAILRDTQTGDEITCQADYAIGADGAKSFTREIVGEKMDAETRPGFMQDVIFDADLSPWVEDRKGSLLYALSPAGIVIFQPLNGVRRWRCQISVQDENMISEPDAIERIRIACGAETLTDITITSMSKWRPTPGVATGFGHGRIFIAGDAAHITVPTGGMGNNTGFMGIRNLAWKLAFVLKGLSPKSILDTYEIEHLPIAHERIRTGLEITDAMIPIFSTHYAGQDTTEAAKGPWFYADYDGVILGFEMASDLIAAETDPAPQPANRYSDFAPVIRSGRRAPHAWLDAKQTSSVLDWFGHGYVLIAGESVDLSSWLSAVSELSTSGVPIELRRLPTTSEASPYSTDALVLVRPDGVIAEHWQQAKQTPDECMNRLRSRLPIHPM